MSLDEIIERLPDIYNFIVNLKFVSLDLSHQIQMWM